MKNEEKYIPERCWVWSPIKGATLNALKNSMTLEEIENYLKEHNAVVCYRHQIYDSVYDVPFVQEYSTTYTYCFPTGSIKTNPQVDLVPKGSYIEKGYCSSHWVFPEGTI